MMYVYKHKILSNICVKFYFPNQCVNVGTTFLSGWLAFRFPMYMYKYINIVEY